MPYWHVTPATELASILATGLEPRIGERSRSVHEPIPAVYLFVSKGAAEYATMNWLGDALPDGPLALLEVSDVPVEETPATYERICLQAIPPRNIAVLSTDF